MFKKQLSPNTFVARGKMFNGDNSVPVIVHGTYNPFEPNPATCSIVPDGKRATFGISLEKPDGIEIRGKSSEGDEIRILGLENISTFYGATQTLKGTINYFIKGDLKEFGAAGGQIYCSAFIPETPLAQAEATYLTSYDGTITLDENSEREGLKWESSLGEVELIDNYEYIDDKVGVDKAIIRIKRCQVYIIIKPKGKFSIENLLRTLPSTLDDPFWLISFLSRKRINWYGVNVMFFPGGKSQKFMKATAVRRTWLGYESIHPDHMTWVDLLIDPKKLRKGLFSELLANYETSEYKSLILRTIPYVLMSYERGYFESHIANTYSALESLVAGLSPDNDPDVGKLLSNNKFKRLSKNLKEVINNEEIDSNIRNGIWNKLGELNRRSIIDRLMILLDRYQVPVTKVWSPEVNIKTKLHEIIRRRNLFIHQGKIDDYSQFYDDMARLRVLIELWILKLINCEDENINDVTLSRFTR